MRFVDHHDHVETDPAGIHVESVREDRPTFRRVYTCKLDGRATIKITMKTYTFGSGRFKSGELTQPNGRWVTFDPDAIADKILDPALVPLVEKACDQIARLDAAFMAMNPSEYTDDQGHIWRRAS